MENTKDKSQENLTCLKLPQYNNNNNNNIIQERKANAVCRHAKRTRSFFRKDFGTKSSLLQM